MALHAALHIDSRALSTAAVVNWYMSHAARAFLRNEAATSSTVSRASAATILLRGVRGNNAATTPRSLPDRLRGAAHTLLDGYRKIRFAAGTPSTIELVHVAASLTILPAVPCSDDAVLAQSRAAHDVAVPMWELRACVDYTVAVRAIAHELLTCDADIQSLASELRRLYDNASRDTDGPRLLERIVGARARPRTTLAPLQRHPPRARQADVPRMQIFDTDDTEAAVAPPRVASHADDTDLQYDAALCADIYLRLCACCHSVLALRHVADKVEFLRSMPLHSSAIYAVADPSAPPSRLLEAVQCESLTRARRLVAALAARAVVIASRSGEDIPWSAVRAFAHPLSAAMSQAIAQHCATIVLAPIRVVLQRFSSTTYTLSVTLAGPPVQRMAAAYDAGLLTGVVFLGVHVHARRLARGDVAKLRIESTRWNGSVISSADLSAIRAFYSTLARDADTLKAAVPLDCTLSIPVEHVDAEHALPSAIDCGLMGACLALHA